MRKSAVHVPPVVLTIHEKRPGAVEYLLDRRGELAAETGIPAAGQLHARERVGELVVQADDVGRQGGGDDVPGRLCRRSGCHGFWRDAIGEAEKREGEPVDGTTDRTLLLFPKKQDEQNRDMTMPYNNRTNQSPYTPALHADK